MGLFGNRYHQRSHHAAAAELYWEKWVASTLSKDQRILLAEQFFQYIWQTQGKEVALNQIRNAKQQTTLAQTRFNRGCQLWGDQYHRQALLGLQKSSEIQEAYPAASRRQEEGGGTANNEQDERHVRMHYALGTVHMALKEYPNAFRQFRHAWRMSGLRLGTNHVLTQASQHMVKTVLLSQMGTGILQVHCQLNRVRHGILHEKEGDFLFSLGDLEAALQEYYNSLPEEEDDDPLAEASIRCKMARIWEQQKRYGHAGDEWASALSLYQSALGSEHFVTIQTMEKLTDNHRRMHRSLFSTCSSPRDDPV
jgi:tetratricopeptide (TPR) repeat protein